MLSSLSSRTGSRHGGDREERKGFPGQIGLSKRKGFADESKKKERQREGQAWVTFPTKKKGWAPPPEEEEHPLATAAAILHLRLLSKDKRRHHLPGAP